MSNGTVRREMAILGLLLSLGIVIGAWVLGSQIKAIRLGDRYVSVRGLAERNVKSDLAIWPVDYKEAGDDLTSLYSKTEADKTVIIKFLTEQGIQPSEIQMGIVRVVDTRASEYGGGNKSPYRYIVDQVVTVRTPHVDEVAAAAQKTITLLQQGIVLNGNGAGLTYQFTGLNSIKPDMITEATRNARTAADRFAADSGSKVGGIRQATQGSFSILAENSGQDTGEPEFNPNADSSLMKTVRVVTNVDYYLEN